MIPVTPRGFKDVLPGEARWREAIVSATRQTLTLWGYAPIETPTLEVLEVLEQGGEITSLPFRLFDTDNELLVLRPDVTLQVARMVASRLKREDMPLRLRYVERVYREEESLMALSRQITQIGVEAIGLAGAEADAEMILLMADVLQAAGLRDFTIALGTVGVLHELLELCVASGEWSSERSGELSGERRSEAGSDQRGEDKSSASSESSSAAKGAASNERARERNGEWSSAMLAAFHAGNLVAIDTLASADWLDPRYAEVLRKLPTICGKAEAIARVSELVEPLGIVDGLEQLSATYAIIEACGLAARVTVDFSVVSAYDYYTGLVFEAYAPGLGKALGNGGRYDRML